MDPAQRLIVPLDLSSPEDASALAARLRGRAGMFKVGLQLFSAAGPSIVRTLAGLGDRVFLDLKLHDIPNTVAMAVAEAARLGVHCLTVHASGGLAMMAAAAEAARRASGAGAGRPLLLGVTVLTSLDAADLERIGVAGPVEGQVVRLARLAREAGLDGVVASPMEIQAIREGCGRDFLIVTPGVRPEGSATADQKRILTPRRALAAGADYLVIGRPIAEAPDPLAALQAIAAEMT